MKTGKLNSISMMLYKQMSARGGFSPKIFQTKKPFTQQFNQWERAYKKCLSKCFKKVRVGRKSVFSSKLKPMKYHIFLGFI